jgi:raffinose/stachyose/melibiose transport system permease protein
VVPTRPIADGTRNNAAFLLPAAVCIGVFYLLPEILNTALAFTNWSFYSSRINFVGVDNFVELGTDQLGQAIWVTARFALVGLVITNVLALGLALALERPTRLHGLLRAILFVPVLISPLAAGYIWSALLDPQGVVNSAASGVLGMVGLGPVQTAWLGSTDFTIYVLSVIFAWKTFGVLLLIYSAGLVSIPGEVCEAASIDGAGYWSVVRQIKLPLLGPAFTACIVLTLTAALSSFDTIVSTTNGGPGGTTEVFNLLVFQLLGQGTLGYAAAVSLILVGLIALVTIPTLRQLRLREVVL